MSGQPAAATLKVVTSPTSWSLVAAAQACAALGGIKIKVEEVEGGQSSLETPEGVHTIPGDIVRSLAQRSGQAALLGDTPEEQGEVVGWFSNPLADLPGPASISSSGSGPSACLVALNLYLQPRAVLIGTGTKVTLADIAAYVSLYDSLKSLAPTDHAKLCHVLRWLDYVQNSADVSDTYPKIAVLRPGFNPPAPATPPPSSRTQGGTPLTNGKAPSPPSKQAARQATAAELATGAVTAGGATTAASETADRAKGKDGKEGQKDSKEGKEGRKDSKEGKEAVEGKGREKKVKAPAAKKEVATGVSVLDIRVGLVTKVWKHPNADALYVEDIDIGEEKTRQVVSGLAKFITEEELQGRHVLVLTNIKPGNVRDVLSQGLVLCASNADHTAVDPVSPPPGAAVGERVRFEGHDGEPELVLNPKKKQFEAVQPDLLTDAAGVAKYKDVPFSISAGVCTSKIHNGKVK